MNEALFRQLNALAGRSAFLDCVIVFFAEDLFVVAGVVIGAFSFLALFLPAFRRMWRDNITLFFPAVCSAFVARLITELIRYFYEHPRPFEVLNGVTQIVQHTGGNSFPSGHASLAFAIAATLSFFWRRGAAWLFLGAALIGTARIIAGIHWPFDIFGGALVGIASAWFVHVVVSRIPSVKS